MTVVALMGGIALFLFTANKDRLDFSEFYAAAQMVREGHGADLYNLRLQSDFQYRIADVHAVYLRPPFETLLFVPFTYFSYRTAYTLWTMVSLALLVLVAFLTEANTGVTLAVTQYSRASADFGLVLAIFVTFAPTMTCILIGQDSILTLLVYTLTFVLLKRGKEFLAGCVLACGLFKFHLVVPFILILILKRKWATVRGFSLITCLLILISVAISGLGILREYPRVLFFNSSSRQMMGFDPNFTPNIHGFLYLIAQRWMPVPLLAATVAMLSIGTIWWAAKNWRDESFGFSFSLSLFATLLASYHLYNYDLTLLLLPVAIVCGELAQRGRLPSNNRILTAALILLFLPPLHFLLVTHGIYALMFVPLLMLFVATARFARSLETGLQAALS